MFMQLHNGVQLDWIYWANKRKALNCILYKRNNTSIKAPLTQFANIIRGFDSYWKSKFTVIIQDLTMSWGQHLHRLLRRTDYKDDSAQVLLVVDCWSSLAKLSQHFVRFNFSHGIAFAHFPYFAQSVLLLYSSPLPQFSIPLAFDFVFGSAPAWHLLLFRRVANLM